MRKRSVGNLVARMETHSVAVNLAFGILAPCAAERRDQCMINYLISA